MAVLIGCIKFLFDFLDTNIFIHNFLDLFESTLELFNNPESSEKFSTQYKTSFPDPGFGRPSQLKRPNNLRVNACEYPFFIKCVGYFQSGLKSFSCYVKVRYATKVIE